MTIRPHVGQVWRKGDNILVIIALSSNWEKVILSGWMYESETSSIGYPEVSFAWLQANYTLDKDYK